MNIGVGLPNTLGNLSRDLIIKWATQAEAGPFSSLAVFDRLVYGSYEPLTTLAAAATITERIKLATTIVIGPLRNSAALAKSAATVDALSGGRLILGLSVGARKDDYEAAQVPYTARGQILTEQLSTLRQHWEDERIGPNPVSPNGPLLIIGGMGDIAFARTARYADGYIFGGGPAKAFARAVDRARAAWVDHGRPGQPVLWAQGYYALGDTATVEAGRAYLRDYYTFTGPFAERIADGLLTTPQAIAQFAREYAEAGCNELVLYPTVADLDQLERLIEVIAGI